MSTHDTLTTGVGGAPTTAPPGWYPADRADGSLQWWDGERWTDDVALPGTPGWPGVGPTHRHESVAAEVLHEMDVVGDEVSTSVVLAWFALIAVLSVAAPIVGASASAGGIVAGMWAIGVVAAIGGAVPFWRGGHRAIAACGVLTAVLVPLVALAAMNA